jgi:hypothetical protein
VIATSNIELDQGAAGEMDLSPGPYIQVDLGVTRSGFDAHPEIRNIVQEARGAVSVRDAGVEGVMARILLPRISVEELPDREPLGAP